MNRLPESVRRNASRLFWDVDQASLDETLHEDFILGRVLSLGDWECVRELRLEMGDEALRSFVKRAPHRLDRRSCRFYEVVLGVSEAPCTTKQFQRSNEPLFQP